MFYFLLFPHSAAAADTVCGRGNQKEQRLQYNKQSRSTLQGTLAGVSSDFHFPVNTDTHTHTHVRPVLYAPAQTALKV